MVAAVTGFPARIRRRPHGGPAASCRYERRRPEKTPLHRVVSRNLESWLEWREAAERLVPGHVEDVLRGYLECGILCFGFARARWTGCGQAFVVAFACKGRGVCPSCNGHHMAQTAAHRVDHVIPPVPVRQWVISVPLRLRGILADRPRAVAVLTKIFLTEIERLLLAASGGQSRRWQKGNVGKRSDATTGGHGGDGHGTGGCCDANQKPRSHDTSRIAWAKLLARVGEEFPLECPNCGGDIRLIAFRLLSECETIPGLRTLGNLRLLRTSCPRTRADPEDPDASWRTARTAADLAGSRTAHRLGRARPGS